MMKPEIKYFKNLDSWDNFQEWYDDFVATCGGTGLQNYTDFECEPNEDKRTYFDGLDRWLYNRYTVVRHKAPTSIDTYHTVLPGFQSMHTSSRGTATKVLDNMSSFIVPRKPASRILTIPLQCT